jgi:hypothetical protein
MRVARSIVLVLSWLLLGCAPAVPTVGGPPAAGAGGSGGKKVADAGSPGGAAGDARLPDARADAAAPRDAPTAPDLGARETAAEAAAAADSTAATDGAHEAAADAPPPPAARAPAPGDLVIDEVLVDPAGSDLGREWFEIASLAADTLDLTSLHVADDATDVAVDAGLLASGGLIVLGQSVDPVHNGGAPVDLAYGTRLQLNNDSDRVAICAGPCAGGVVLDMFAWAGTLGAAYQGRAVIIDRAAATICPATTTFGTEGSFGSPGAPNPPCPRPDAGAADGVPATGDAGTPDAEAADAATE